MNNRINPKNQDDVLKGLIKVNQDLADMYRDLPRVSKDKHLKNTFSSKVELVKALGLGRVIGFRRLLTKRKKLLGDLLRVYGFALDDQDRMGKMIKECNIILSQDGREAASKVEKDIKDKFGSRETFLTLIDTDKDKADARPNTAAIQEENLQAQSSNTLTSKPRI